MSRGWMKHCRRYTSWSKKPEKDSKLEQHTEDTSRIQFDSPRFFPDLLGHQDEHLRVIERALHVKIAAANNTLVITGDETQRLLAGRVATQLYGLLQNGYPIYPSDVDYAIRILSRDRSANLKDIFLDTVYISAHRRTITPKSIAQKAYIEAVRRFDIVFGIGPAGTGKTYLAMAMAVAELMKHKVIRVVLTRPAVEAGEKLGFLPGDLAEKINPYLRPLYDALYDMVDYDRASKMIERGTIEVAPLAFMRGRAQPLSSRVLTPTGWREIGSLHVGDDVIGSDGRPTAVLGVYSQGKKAVFQLTATDGAMTRCCAEHLWAVSTPADRRRGKGNRILETGAMMDRLHSAHQPRYELPLLSEPVRFPTREVPLDPYALGLLLGDGCLTGKTTPTFSTADHEMVTALETRLDNIDLVYKSGVDYVRHHTHGGRGGVIVSNPVTEKLRALGLCGTRSNTKFVPPVYLYNDPAVRLAVLQGLLDTDGGPVTQKDRSCRVQFCTSSPQLRDDVIFLVRSLGGVTYGRTRRQEDKKPGYAHGRAVVHRTDSYVLDIRLPQGMSPFQLSRKAGLYTQYGGGRPMRFIKAITPAGIEETACIRVAAPDQLYVTEDFILTHNTLNDSFVILDEAQNTTSEQMKMFLTRLGYGSKAVITGDVTQVDLPTGTRSGLKEAQRILRGIEGINFSFFSEKDVVRHRLVQDVIMAYERAHDEQERFEEERREQRRLRTQERFDHRHFGQGPRSEPEGTAHVGPHDPVSSAPDTGRTQPSISDGPNDPRPEPPVSREGQTD